MLAKWLIRRLVYLGVALIPLAAYGTVGAAVPERHSGPAISATNSVVGFWMGEDAATPQGEATTSPANYYDPAYRGELTPAVWRALRDYRVPLYLNVRYGRDFGPVQAGARSDAISLVRKANTLGVPVIAWVVVPYADGYWAYQGNAQIMLTAVKAWAAWKRANHLRFAAVALDQEFSLQGALGYIAAISSRNRAKMAAWMSSNIDPAAQCRALETYRDLISWAHVHGIRVDAAVTSMAVDSFVDGNLALQNALQITGSSPGYSQMYLMAYRSSIAQYFLGADPGSGYVAHYYTLMHKFFGPAGQVSLGVAGQDPYRTLPPLVNDVRMLAGMGAENIPIYSLETFVAKFGAGGIRTIAQAARHPMKGAALARAQALTAAGKKMLSMTKAQSALASRLTLAVTKRRGHPQQPNRWPGGCGNLSVRPLAAARD